MIGGRGPAGFVGRQRELTALREWLDATTRGDGAVALVTGVPGIGKTRMLAELSQRARAAGWTVLGGTCLRYRRHAAVTTVYRGATGVHSYRLIRHAVPTV